MSRSEDVANNDAEPRLRELDDQELSNSMSDAVPVGGVGFYDKE